jgi:hypothetical protein
LTWSVVRAILRFTEGGTRHDLHSAEPS